MTTRLREPRDSRAQRTRRAEKWILLAQPQAEVAQQPTYIPSLRLGPACPFPRSRPLHLKPPDSLTLSTFSGGGGALRLQRALGQPIPSVAPPPHPSHLPRIKFRFQSLVKRPPSLHLPFTISSECPSLKRVDSTCRDAPLSSRSHPLAKPRPSRNSFLRGLLSVRPLSMTPPTNARGYQNPSE